MQSVALGISSSELERDDNTLLIEPISNKLITSYTNFDKYVSNNSITGLSLRVLEGMLSIIMGLPWSDTEISFTIERFNLEEMIKVGDEIEFIIGEDLKEFSHRKWFFYEYFSNGKLYLAIRRKQDNGEVGEIVVSCSLLHNGNFVRVVLPKPEGVRKRYPKGLEYSDVIRAFKVDIGNLALTYMKSLSRRGITIKKEHVSSFEKQSILTGTIVQKLYPNIDDQGRKMKEIEVGLLVSIISKRLNGSITAESDDGADMIIGLARS